MRATKAKIEKEIDRQKEWRQRLKEREKQTDYKQWAPVPVEADIHGPDTRSRGPSRPSLASSKTSTHTHGCYGMPSRGPDLYRRRPWPLTSGLTTTGTTLTLTPRLASCKSFNKYYYADYFPQLKQIPIYSCDILFEHENSFNHWLSFYVYMFGMYIPLFHRTMTLKTSELSANGRKCSPNYVNNELLQFCFHLKVGDGNGSCKR